MLSDNPASQPLVSIVIPAFKPKYFDKALLSAVRQTYSNIEIIVSDDSSTDEIKNIVDIFSDMKPIRYYKNERKECNDQKCFDLAEGEYIKFLCDDDLLHPDCVKQMVRVFEKYGNEITLATSKRSRIDSQDHPLPDDNATQILFGKDTIASGRETVDFMLINLVNVVGEPTTVMFRKNDLKENKPSFFSLNGKEFQSLTDLSTWIYLLNRGNFFYFASTLSAFRIHSEQISEQGNPYLKFMSVVEWYNLIKEARMMGFLHDPTQYQMALYNLKIVLFFKLSFPDILKPYQEEFKKYINLVEKDLAEVNCSQEIFHS